MDTRTQLVKAIESMLHAGEKITISSVAAKCEVSHSLIYNRYPDLKEWIKDIRKDQIAKQKAEGDENLINTLLARNKTLKLKIKAESSGQEKAAFRSMLVHIQQIYSMYDQLLEDRNNLASRLSKK